MIKEIREFLGKDNNRLWRNLILILFLVFANSYMQIMCIPTLWAAVIIFLCFLGVVIYPVIKEENVKLVRLISFINGVLIHRLFTSKI